MPSNLTLQREHWFAWMPVIARNRYGTRVVWFETIIRERYVTPNSVGAWRYIAN